MKQPVAKVKVWDLAVRIFHWGVALLVLAAFLTSEEDESIPLHTKAGLAVLGAVVFRVAWGIWGSPHARFKAFVRSPREVLAYAREFVRGRPPVHASHNPLGGMMVVALLLTLLATALTGALTYAGPEWGGALAASLTKGQGKALKELHEGLASLLLGLVGVHVAGVLVSSLLERQNLILGMISGRKRAPGPAEEPLDSAAVPQARRARSLAGLLGAVLLGYAAVRGVLWLLPIPSAEAATPAGPRALLSDYQSEARRESAAFAGFDAARGRTLFVTQVALDGPGTKASACTTCHTSDPRQPGRSPAGKLIDPLAPSANPERFTDRKKADKWFDRNCKQVLGRPCSNSEKGDLLTYLLKL